MEAAPGSERAPSDPARGPWAWIARAEDTLLALSLAGIVLLPLVEALLRRTMQTGVSGSTTIVQHLTLFVGVFGGMVAARKVRLLSLSTVDTLLRGRARSTARSFAFGVAAAVTVFLCWAAVEFVRAEREAGEELVYGVPRWVVQAFLPLAFGMIALRLCGTAGSGWGTRLATAGVAAVLAALAVFAPIEASQLTAPLLVLLALATVFGAPVFATLGGAALILFWGEDTPIATVTIDHYSLVTNPTLPSIPLFTLAGYFLAEGGASGRLMRVFQALLGRVRGGPAVITALVCAFFTSFTGASGVTILALSGLLMPILLDARYRERDAVGLITGAGSLGLLLPPCLPVILYAIVAKVPMEEMFLGGMIPGTLLIGLTAAWGISRGPRIERSKVPFDAREALRALWAAKWELALPLVALGSLFGGFATPVEAAALTALYAGVVGTVVHRDLGARAVARVLVECGLLVGGVLLILGVAQGFTNYLVYAEFPDTALEWIRETVESPWVFLLCLNLFLIVVGCLMDVFSAIVVVAPLIVPMGIAFGIDPVHLGIIFLANLELGYLTPPVGMNLFLASYRLNKPMPELYRAVVPMIIVLLIGVLLITYVPWMTTALPQWAAK